MNDENIPLEKDIKTLVATSLMWQAKYEEVCKALAEMTMERDRFNAVTVTAVKQNCELMDKLVKAQKDSARLRELIVDWSDAVMSTEPCPSESMAAKGARHLAVDAAIASHRARSIGSIDCGDATGAFDPSLCQFDPCKCEVAEAAQLEGLKRLAKVEILREWVVKFRDTSDRMAETTGFGSGAYSHAYERSADLLAAEADRLEEQV